MISFLSIIPRSPGQIFPSEFSDQEGAFCLPQHAAHRTTRHQQISSPTTHSLVRIFPHPSDFCKSLSHNLSGKNFRRNWTRPEIQCPRPRRTFFSGVFGSERNLFGLFFLLNTKHPTRRILLPTKPSRASRRFAALHSRFLTQELSLPVCSLYWFFLPAKARPPLKRSQCRHFSLSPLPAIRCLTSPCFGLRSAFGERSPFICTAPSMVESPPSQFRLLLLLFWIRGGIQRGCPVVLLHLLGETLKLLPSHAILSTFSSMPW